MRACFQARSPLAQEAHRKFQFKLVPHVISRCKYNYQRENQNAETCPVGFDCRTDAVTVHKPHYLGGGVRAPQTKKGQWPGTNQWYVSTIAPPPLYNANMWRKFIFTCSPGTGPSNTRK